MIEYVYNTLRNGLRKLDMKLERAKYGYIEKLPKNIKYFDGGMYDAIYESSCKWPHNTAFQYFNVEVTYKEMIKKINKVAMSFKALGVEKGDRVTICMPNTPEAVYSFYAVNEIGAIANMIHPLSSEKEIEYYLNEADSKVMICIDVSFSKVEAIFKNTNLEKVVVVSPLRSMGAMVRTIYNLAKHTKHIKQTREVISWNKFMSLGSQFVGNPHARVNSDDPAVILYTGGTTGTPKGVVLTNMNFNAQALGGKYLVSDILKQKNSMLTFLPNFHAFGLGVCTHVPFYNGMKIVLIPQFNAKKLKSYIKKYKINILVGVPAVFEYLKTLKLKKNDLKRIRGAVSGGDIVSEVTKQEINDFLKAHGSSAVLRNGYGLTESTGGVVFSTIEAAFGADTVGYPLPDSEVIIIDPKTHKEVPLGKDGEIAIRGLTVMKGYYNRPKETAEAFATVKGKKYLKTGDIGYVDKKGIVHFVTRLKRIIITNGYNVYPTTIESVTSKCKLVSKCTCVGVHDKTRGEKVKIFIILKPNASERAAKKELTKIYKQYLAKYEIPRDIAFLDSFPQTKMNKVDFRALQNM
ncbi:MAG: class I adenylate-forming enzyme family protein [Candidatus Saccharibacteria bacterium]|nr:class I adenylate-forming enzyme family protein [Candidatus Saccharibacteria bacterium]